MINKDRNFFQYNSGNLVYTIYLLTSQLRTLSRKLAIKYVGPLVVYKIYRSSQLRINDTR